MSGCAFEMVQSLMRCALVLCRDADDKNLMLAQPLHLVFEVLRTQTWKLGLNGGFPWSCTKNPWKLCHQSSISDPSLGHSSMANQERPNKASCCGKVTICNNSPACAPTTGVLVHFTFVHVHIYQYTRPRTICPTQTRNRDACWSYTVAVHAIERLHTHTRGHTCIHTTTMP